MYDTVTVVMLLMILCWKIEKQQVSRGNCVCVCVWVGERERDISVLLNDADNCEDYIALILDEWNMSGDLAEGYMTGENRSKGKGKVHPTIGQEGPEVESRSSRRKKKSLSQCHKSKNDWD